MNSVRGEVWATRGARVRACGGRPPFDALVQDVLGEHLRVVHRLVVAVAQNALVDARRDLVQARLEVRDRLGDGLVLPDQHLRPDRLLVEPGALDPVIHCAHTGEFLETVANVARLLELLLLGLELVVAEVLLLVIAEVLVVLVAKPLPGRAGRRRRLNVLTLPYSLHSILDCSTCLESRIWGTTI